MRIVNSKEFDTWLDALIAGAAEGNELSSVKLGLVAAELAVLRSAGRPADA